MVYYIDAHFFFFSFLHLFTFVLLQVILEDPRSNSILQHKGDNNKKLLQILVKGLYKQHVARKTIFALILEHEI